MINLARMLFQLLADVVCLVALSLRWRRAIEAENLVLRRQLARYVERGLSHRRVDPATRLSLAFLSGCCDWRSAIVVVRPETIIRWHRAGWRLFLRWKSRPGRKRIPVEVRQLIRRMSAENFLWGEERIANELLLKLGIKVSPRTVRRYMVKRPPGKPRGDLRWSTFLKNQALGIIACDFLTTSTLVFGLQYIFVVVHHTTRRLLHFNVTQHPTSAWTLQQLKHSVADEEGFTHLLHDRDSIFVSEFDRSAQYLGLAVIRSPPQSPKANAICERLIGTLRRECLDWVIPLSEHHLRAILKSWAEHYNLGRRHSSLGPGIPYGPPNTTRRRGAKLVSACVLSGLHHEYAWS